MQPNVVNLRLLYHFTLKRIRSHRVTLHVCYGGTIRTCKHRNTFFSLPKQKKNVFLFSQIKFNLLVCFLPSENLFTCENNDFFAWEDTKYIFLLEETTTDISFLHKAKDFFLLGKFSQAKKNILLCFYE